MTTPKTLRSWFDGHTKLLRLERASEKEEFDLLTSEKVKRGQTKLLERMGISIGALGVRSTNIGLGGKTIVELERPAQYHTDPKLPYHVLRSGVPVGIIDHLVGASKPSKKNSAPHDKLEVIEGVVSKVSETCIAVTIGSLKDDSDQLELPARCRLIKLADTATFDRLEQTMDLVLQACQNAGLLAESSEQEVKAKVTQSDKEKETKDDKEKETKGDAASVINQKPEQRQQEPALSASKRSLQKSSVKLTDLMRVLLGIDPIKLPSEEDIDRIPLPSVVRDLNMSQQYAVKHALSSCPVTLVFGPPGTGKTHTLVSIIAALHARGDRIIVAAASNLAVDNIAERLIEMKLGITRIGHPARVLETLTSSTLEHQLSTSDESEIIRDLKREINQNLAKLSAQGKERIRGKARGAVYKDVQELRKDYRHRERGHTRNIIKAARIICATAHGAGSRQLENETFDVVIIDESTQAFEAVGDCVDDRAQKTACWIPILKAKSKLILAGDPLQLPPTVKSMKPRPTRPDTKKSEKKKTAGEKNSIKGKAPPPGNAQSPDEGNEEEDGIKEEVGKAEEGGKKKEDAMKEEEVKEEPECNANETSEDDDGNPEDLSSQAAEKISLKTPPRRPLMKRPRTLETTMFYRLLKNQPEISCLLNVQYRMHEMIMKFPSDQLYESKLKAADLVATHLLKDLPNVTRDETDGIVDPVLLIDNEGGEGSLMNENEAELVVQRVNALIECGVLPTQIMVISPYAAQVSLLNSLLKPQYPSLAIGSIDSCQGRENEAVIISLCRSNAQGVVGFLSEKRRLNVAMTRAKRHLTVIGDSDTLSKGGPFLQNWMRWLEDHAEVRVASL